MTGRSAKATGARRAFAGLALSAGALGATILLIEAALRVGLPGELVPIVERDAVLGWRGRPALSCSHRPPGFEFALPVVHNAAGFRDRDHAIAKPGGVARVLCVGDSFTWGWGVREDAVYTRVLEAALRERGRDVEVLNAGVQGYNTVQSLLYLRTRGFSYSPDVVVYQASDNDIEGNLPFGVSGVWLYPHATPGRDGRPSIEGTPLPGMKPVAWLKYQATRHSRLFSLLRTRVGSLRRAGAGADAGGGLGSALAAADGSCSPAFRLFAGLIRELRDECAARGVRLVVLLDFGLTEAERRCLEETCPGLETVLAARYLEARERDSGALALFPHDGHWTEDAHRWIAQCLADSAFGAGTGLPSAAPDPPPRP